VTTPIRATALATAWLAKARFDYWRLGLRPPRFTLFDRTYPIHVAWYNKTWRNERQVEVPPVLELIRQTDPEETLEIGNVLAHYVTTAHTVVDKYEDDPGTLRVDVVDYEPGRKFSLIVAISTLEHVGWDEPERDPAKFRRAIHHLAGLLAPGGLLWASVPLGHNPSADAFLRHPDAGFEVSFLIRGSKRPGDWREATAAAPEAYPYEAAIPTAQAVAILRHRAPDAD
jgi:SAM-dependent methyltransferase